MHGVIKMTVIETAAVFLRPPFRPYTGHESDNIGGGNALVGIS